jgi:hypothetical protein
MKFTMMAAVKRRTPHAEDRRDKRQEGREACQKKEKGRREELLLDKKGRKGKVHGLSLAVFNNTITAAESVFW